jgi:CBS domain-containing protein
MNTVGYMLKSKGSQVSTVPLEASVLDALKVMAEKKIGSVLVMEGDRLAGIFTERDFAHKIGPKRKDISRLKITEVMTSDLITVTPEHSVNTCMSLMTDNHIRHLPVLQDGKLIGIVSIGDVVKDIIEELRFMLEQFEKYIQGLR